MKSVPSYTANIYVGLRPAYSDKTHTYSNARKICQDYCDLVGLCVTVTNTNFIYKGGSEPGIIVGLINYPRFPSMRETIRGHAINLAGRLKLELGQLRVSIVFPDETIMLGDDEQVSGPEGK